MMTICPICEKNVCIHWPEHWVYRRGPTYYCSDQCMDVAITRSTKLLNSVLFKKRKDLIMNNKITLEMKKKAAQIAIDGGNPLPYLKQHGAKNPSATWQYVRKCLEKADPEMYAKLPDRLPKTAGETPETPSVAECMENMKEAAEELFSNVTGNKVTIDVPAAAETPETQKKISLYPNRWKAIPFTIRSVETPAGMYTVNNGYFEFKSSKDKSDAIEMKVEDFVQFAGELPTVMEMLGVMTL